MSMMAESSLVRGGGGDSPTGTAQGPVFHGASVSHPAKRKTASHITFQVLVRFSHSPASAEDQFQQAVFRRYSDFDWLYHYLVVSYPGHIVPPPPEKSLRHRFEEQFLEERRFGLHQFVQRVIQHPQFQRCRAVRVFMLGSDEELGQLKQRESRLKLGNLRKGRPRDADASDIACEEIADFASQLEDSLLAIQETAEQLIKRSGVAAKNWQKLGEHFQALGGLEQAQSESRLGRALLQAADSADTLGSLMAERAEEDARSFCRPIQDHLRLIGALRIALRVRSNALAQFQTAKVALEKARKRRQQLSVSEDAGVGGSKFAQVEMAEREAELFQDRCGRDLDAITQTVVSEATRFRKEKQRDLRLAVLELIRLQETQSRERQKCWSRLLSREELERRANQHLLLEQQKALELQHNEGFTRQLSLSPRPSALSSPLLVHAAAASDDEGNLSEVEDEEEEDLLQPLPAAALPTGAGAGAGSLRDLQLRILDDDREEDELRVLPTDLVPVDDEVGGSCSGDSEGDGEDAADARELDVPDAFEEDEEEKEDKEVDVGDGEAESSGSLPPPPDDSLLDL